MQVDATKIHQGPGNIWIQVHLPATGSRLLIDANGNPTEGSPIYGGAIESATTFNPSAKMELLEADQISAPVAAIMTGEADGIDATMMESDLAKLRYYIQHGSYASGTDAGLPVGAQNYEELSFGGIIPVLNYPIAAISPRRDVLGKFVVSQLYSVVQVEAVKLPYTRKKATVYAVKFVGLAVTTRPVGDQVGKIYRQV
jgi:hypothetical protein